MVKNSFLAIDPLRLDQEWMGQPRLYHEYARKLADCRMVLDEAKNSLEILEAELYLKISQNPEEFELPKTTEAVIKSAVVSQLTYQEALVQIVQAKHDVAVYEAAVTALEHRKRALEKSVDLLLADYFSAPKAARPASKEAMEQADKKLNRPRAKQRQV